MGLADIAVSALKSEQVRSAIGNSGTRIFKSSFESANKDDNGGFLGWVWNGAQRLGGWLLENAGKFISFSLSSIWGWITSTLQFIWNFDWNMTDKSIDEQIRAKWDALGSQLGGLAGNFIGYLGCGVLPGAAIMAFNEPMGAYILANVTEEMAEEFIGNLAGVVNVTFRSAAETLLMWSFKNVRKLIKSNSLFFKGLFGDKAEAMIKAWGEEGSQPWSFAKATEEAVEKIPNTFVRNFVEEFLEEAWDGCVEAGYVVANSIDSWVAMEKFKQQNMPILGETKYLEVTPNRNVPEEKIILAGPQELVKVQVINTLTNYQLMSNKDIGTVYSFEPETAHQRRWKPQVVLKFQESKEDFKSRKKTDKKARRLKGEISFRLMDKSSETITMDYIQTLANKVKAKFGTPPYAWHKGKTLISYTDYDKGYQFCVLGVSDAESRRLIENILDLQGHSPDWEKAQNNVNLAPEKAYPEVPDKKTILGKVEEQPTRRRSVKIQFEYAQIFLHGRFHPVTLFDLTGRWRDVVVRKDTQVKT